MNTDNHEIAKANSNKNMTALHAEMVKLNPAYTLEELGYYGLAITLKEGEHEVTLYAEHCGRRWSGPLTTYLRVKTDSYQVAYKHNATFATKNLVTKFHNMMEDFMHILKENKKAEDESQAKDKAAIIAFKVLWNDQLRKPTETEDEWRYRVTCYHHEIQAPIALGVNKDLNIKCDPNKNTYEFNVEGVTKNQADRIIAILREGVSQEENS